MSWANPLNPAQVSGKGLLTRDKPITRIHKAIHEIQEKAVTGTDVQILGVNLSSCRVKDNKLFIRGAVSGDVLGEGGGGGGAGGSLEDRVDALESALSGATLALDVEIVGGALKVTGGLTWGNGGGTVSNSGNGVEVTSCGTE